MRWLRILFSIAAASLLLVTLLSFLGELIAEADLAASFRPQLFAIAAVLLLLGLLAWSRWTVILALLAVAANVWQLVPYYASSGPGTGAQADVSIMVVNLAGDAGNISMLRQLVERHRPDLLVVTEVTDAGETALQPLEAEYRFSAAELRNSPYNVLLLSRHNLVAHQFLYPTAGYLPVLDARLCATTAVLAVETAGAPCYSLVALHAAQPLGEGNIALRNKQLSYTASIAARDGNRPVLVAGDLNITPWSFAFGRIFGAAGLRDVSLGHGINPTWFSRFPLLGLPIDHVLANRHFQVLQVEVLPSIGSDHFPLLVGLAFAQQAAGGGGAAVEERR